MELLSRFDEFDLKDGKVPELFSGTFQFIADRARKILMDCDREQIEYAIQSINWIFQDFEFELISENKNYINNFSSPTETLNQQSYRFDITGQQYFPNATWPKYLAALSLSIIGLAFRKPPNTRAAIGLSKNDIQTSQLEYAGELAVLAMEAVCRAESLLTKESRFSGDSENPLKSTKDKLRLNNKRASIIRHAKGREIKDRFVEFYYSRNFKSIAEAARLFHRGLDKDEQTKICPSNIEGNAVRTLRDHLKIHG